MSMYNFMHNQNAIERAGRREIKIVRLLEQLIAYCKFLKTFLQSGGETIADDADRHPLAAISCLMKVSFDEEYRHTMCNFDALQIISNLVYLDIAVHGTPPADQCCNSLRRYALMALTNLTFGDENNKSILCRQRQFMNAIVGQLETAPDDLLQVIASVLRNLSWRPDNNTKIVLNKIGAVTVLVEAAMRHNQNENTLKAILSALWNLSAHCSTNKVELCAVKGALAFLVDMLTFEAPSKTLKIVENAGGILRNVSSHIAVCENYRRILRDRKCLAILLQHLKSDNMTLVSNSCGTLWNLSARCQADQHFLLEHGAIPLLRSLTQSKHAMISEGSTAALKNLLAFRTHLQQQQQHKQQQQQQLQQSSTGISSKWLKSAAFKQVLKEPTVKQPNAQPLTKQQLDKNQSSIISGLQSIVLTASNSRESIYAAKSTSMHLTRQRSKSLDYLLISNEHQKTEVKLKHEMKISSINNLHTSKRSSEKIKYRSSYQETDLDQLTDFSLRYIENQIERDVESPPPIASGGTNFKLQTCLIETKEVRNKRGTNEIVCIEDNVKCYQTEGTPYMISNAASVDDLTNNKTDSISMALKSPVIHHTVKYVKKSIIAPTTTTATTISESTNTYSGLYNTPDNPINYCEEGTPYYFSRRESLNSLHEISHSVIETPSSSDKKLKQFKIDAVHIETAELVCDGDGIGDNGGNIGDLMPEKSILQGEQRMNRLSAYSAQETPLMFSRSSSIDSLHDEDLPTCDDLSSVQSDFSRLASGIISPSDIPDSPTQLMPRSPSVKGLRKLEYASAPLTLEEKAQICELNAMESKPKLKAEAHSVFEDNLNMFQVENTPAQFSCATSLSNLSIADDDNEQQPKPQSKPQLKTSQNNIPQGEDEEEEEEEETHENDDEFLLASCINIGMNRPTYSTLLKSDDLEKPTKYQEVTKYYTENTPAMYSNLGSNTNLSTISIASCNNEPKDNVSSFNTSEDSAADEANLLQQCINDGMQMSKTDPNSTATAANNNKLSDLSTNPPTHSSEMTVMPSCSRINEKIIENSDEAPKILRRSPKKCLKRQEHNLCNESLSSLSTDTEDDEDTLFLSQAIAAGYNRSKSHNSEQQQKQQQQRQQENAMHNSSMSTKPVKLFDEKSGSAMQSTCDKATNSSVDSSDSSDNQSKSLLELCIRTGMHKKDQRVKNVKMK